MNLDKKVTSTCEFKWVWGHSSKMMELSIYSLNPKSSPWELVLLTP